MKITVEQFTSRIVNMKDLGEWDDTPDAERADVFYDALYAIFHAARHNNDQPMFDWIEDNEARIYDFDDDKLPT